MKKTRCSTSDNFSLLPDEVIGNILARVPLQEAANTSILSRRWRFMWRLIPEIIFDDSFCKEYMLDNEDDLMRTIDHVLLLHTGPIHKFNLSLSNLVRSDYVDRVIYSVLRRGIKDFSYGQSRKSYRYRLPLSLFSCEQLEHLNLCRCMVSLPTGFQGFGKLVSLEFHCVSINGNVCSTLISGCPLLERLTLKYLNSLDQIEIVAPNLKFFQCKGTFSCICFKNTPRLESLSMILRKHTEGEAPKPVVLYDSLPALQFLELCDVSFKYIVAALIGDAQNRLASELNHLKVLKLYGISFGNKDEASSVFSLIRSSKNLENLTIKINSDRWRGFLEIMDLPDISVDRLRKVRMENVAGLKMELFFIKYILANASKLLNMVIVPPTPLDLAMTFGLLAEVTQFRRESRLAQITLDEQV